jgi:hypothetical protein
MTNKAMDLLMSIGTTDPAGVGGPGEIGHAGPAGSIGDAGASPPPSCGSHRFRVTPALREWWAGDIHAWVILSVWASCRMAAAGRI